MTDDRHTRHTRSGRIARRLGPAAGIPLLLPVAVAAVPLWAFGAATRSMAGWRALEPSDPRNLVEYAPVLGMRPRTHLNTVGRGQDVFRVTADTEGWRGRQPLDEAQVIALGDSFAFGYGVDDDDHFGAVASRRVKAVASPAYRMVHAALLLDMLHPGCAAKPSSGSFTAATTWWTSYARISGRTACRSSPRRGVAGGSPRSTCRRSRGPSAAPVGTTTACTPTCVRRPRTATASSARPTS